jgi:ATP-dependent DNA helicase RecG
VRVPERDGRESSVRRHQCRPNYGPGHGGWHLPGGSERHSQEGLDRLELRAEGQLLRAVVVLFGRKPFLAYYPQCGLRMARFKGVDKTEFLDNRQLHGHAFKLLDEAMHFILRNIPIAGHFEPGKMERQDTPLYPPLALREALVNALCHRDYTIAGGAISVAIFDDCLEISSTGLLPAGIPIAALKRKHRSLLRNPFIAGVFYQREGGGQAPARSGSPLSGPGAGRTGRDAARHLVREPAGRE